MIRRRLEPGCAHGGVRQTAHFDHRFLIDTGVAAVPPWPATAATRIDAAKHGHIVHSVMAARENFLDPTAPETTPS